MKILKEKIGARHACYSETNSQNSQNDNIQNLDTETSLELSRQSISRCHM